MACTQARESGPKDCLTLTFPAIMHSKKVILLLAGKEKKEALNDLLYSNKSVEEMPARKLLEHANVTIHYSE